MKSKKFVACLSAGVLAAAAVTVAGQTRAGAPTLTPDGKPDLQGVWLNISATPLERPKQLEGRQFLTDEEVAELKKRAARLFNLNSNSDAAGGDTYFLALLANPQEFRNPNATGSASVMIERDIENRTSLIVAPADGKIPPLTREGQERLARSPTPNAAGQNRAAGPEDLSSAMRCITYGTPRLGVQNINAAGPMGYYQILQTPQHLVLFLEAIHETRIIPLDGRPHLPETMRQWAGDSRGRWEGNSLVVETTNFSPQSRFMGAAENLRVVERFTRVSRRHARLRNHARGSDDVDKTVDRADSPEAGARQALRVRLSRREFRDDGRDSGRGSCGRSR